MIFILLYFFMTFESNISWTNVSYNLLLLFSQLFSSDWRWEGHMSNLLTISNCDNIHINKSVYAYFCVLEP